MTGKIIIHCVRHAQGFHNLCDENHAIPDPLLTPLGKTQCANFSTTFLNPANVTHIIASPLRRTMYTALYSFPTQVASGIVVRALPETQETGALPCNTGSSPSDLAAEFSAGEGSGKFKGAVDLSRVHEGWNSNIGRWFSAPSNLEARALLARQYLLSFGLSALSSPSPQTNANGDMEIVVVTHGGFLHYFTDDWQMWDTHQGTGWANMETRNYEFVTGVQEGAALRETEQSWTKRKGDEVRLTADQQRVNKTNAMKTWTACGFQDKEIEVKVVEAEARL